MIGAVVALEDEAEALLSQMKIEDIRTIYGKTVHLGRAFGKECLLVVCGVGKVNAAAGACAAIHFGADVILNFGVAGGLHERTELTEVYLVEKAVQYDFDITQLEGTEIGTLDGETENFLPLSTPKASTSPAASSRRATASTTPRRSRPSPPLRRRPSRHGRRRHRGSVQVRRRALRFLQGGLGRVRLGQHDGAVRKNLSRACLNLKAYMGEVFAALD